MVIVIEDGTTVLFSQATGGEKLVDSKGQQITVSQVGSTNTYTATVALNDGSGRSQTFRFDKPDVLVTFSRKVA
jgi:hypothetical protein